jgi:polygalacturonase
MGAKNFKIYMFVHLHVLISVGSLGGKGANDQVSNIYVRNCTFIGTTNGARIKTIPVSMTNMVNEKNSLFNFSHYFLQN